MRTSFGRWFCSTLVVIGLALAAFGQGGATGAITGSVQDPSGAYVAGADVRITSQETGVLVRTVKTDANGSFTAPLLPVGTYTVTVRSAGFAEGSFPDIAVRVTETTRMIAKLRTQAVQEKVEVQAQVQAVETTDATTGQAIEEQTIRELPLATQNFQQLLTLSTGVYSELNASAQLGRGSNKIFVNGQREDNNNYLIEGISATDYNVAQTTNVPLPNPDVIGEFKVQTSLYDASQGRNGGGNVNAILKSGTKSFHGDVYEFFRNDVLNANEYFLNQAGQPRPSVKQNIFGGSLGGPIGSDGKFGFFFINYQGTRQRSGESPGTAISNPGFPILPAQRDAATLAKDFSTPLTPGCPVVPPLTIDPVILKLLNFKSNQFGGDANGYLIPSLPGTPGVTVNPTTCLPSINTAPFFLDRPGRYTDDQFTTNWDREFRGGKDKLSARFFFSDAESFLPFGAGGLPESLGSTLQSSVSATDLDFPFDLPIAARFFSVDETHLFSPALVNDFRFGWVHIHNSLDNINPVTAADLGIDRPTNNVTQSIYKFTLNSSGFQLGPAPFADQHQTQDNFNFVDNFSWVHRSHVLSWGGDFTRVGLDKLFPQVFNGQLIFASFANGSPLTDFQSFLEGAPPFSFGGGGVYNHEYRANDFGFYAQDDWKARKDLTLNLGLRTEIIGGFYDNLCHIGNADPQLADEGKYPFIYGSCVKGLGIPGLNPTGSNTTYKNDYATGLGPRIGFAWDIFGHHTTSLRGGYGIYYVREDVGSVDQLSFNAPFLPVAFGGGAPGCAGTFFSATVLPGCPSPNPNALPAGGVIDPAFIPCLAVFQGFPGNDTTQAPNFSCPGGAPGLTSQGIFVLPVPRHFVTPNTQQWNLSLQRELGRRWVLEVGYVGTHSIHLRETRTPLQAQNVSPSNPLVITAANGTPYKIMYDTISNGPARSRSLPINGYSGMQAFIDDAYSHYHSLQTTLSRRWGNGYFQAAYTFSRSTDATSSGNTAFATAWNDESSLTASRGLSDFDRTHRLVASYRYDLPFYRSANGPKGALLSNWSISGISIFQSGTPFSVFDSAAGTAFLGSGLAPTLGAELAPGATIATGTTSGGIHQRLNGYLNINNFVPAPLLYPKVTGGNPAFECDPINNPNFCGTNFGNLGRNIYRGPFQQNWDFSLIKNFNLTERQTLRFTTDFFNIWNHANFANPAQNDVENPSTFGRITQTVGTPRLIQFSLRYAF
jgi:Carboxypeptidase regulatory-like domain/TonB dependent receptor